MNEKEQKQLDRKLYEAASEVKFEEVKELIKKGANVNRKFTYEGSSLHAVAPRYHKDDAAKILQYLIDNGGDVNMKATGGKTPLGAAVDNVSFKTMDILLKNGADINLKGEKGRTPLNVLLSSSWRRDDDRCLEIAKTLVEAGADINIKDKEKKSPYLHAILQGYRQTADYLKKLGSKDIKLFITTNSYDGEERMYIDKKNIPNTIEGCNVDLIGEGTFIEEHLYLPKHSDDPIGSVKTRENKYYFCWLPDFCYSGSNYFLGKETSEEELEQIRNYSE